MVLSSALEAGRCITNLMCKGSTIAACKNVGAVFILGDGTSLVEDPYRSICYEFSPIFSGGKAEDH